MPLDFLLRLMRDPQSPIARRLEAAKAAAPFLRAKLNAVDAKLSPAVAEPSPEESSNLVEFVMPNGARTQEDQTKRRPLVRFLCAFRRSCKPPSAGLFPLTRTPKCLRMRGTDERSVKSGGHLVQSLIRPLELAAPPLKRGGGEPESPLTPPRRACAGTGAPSRP
jgi:hypothetical protein